MAQYSEGWITIPGKGKRYRLSDGSYKESNPYNRFDKPLASSGSPTFDEGVSQLMTNLGFGGQRRDQAQVDAAREKRNRELLPPGSKMGRLPVSQGGAPTFGTPGINPRTGLPYSESPGKSSTAPETPATTGGRSDTRVIPGSGGATQTGTNMGAINMPGLEDADLTGIANFNGPSFPTQAETNKITDGYRFTASEFLTNPKNEDGSAYEAPGGTPETTNIAINGNTFRPNTFAKGAAGDIGGLDGFKPGGKFAGAPTATDGQDDDGWGAPNPADYAQSNEEMRRRSAFLDAKDSMSGMQAVAAGMGMGNQGLRNFANVDGKAVEMSSEDRRAILNAAPGEAQALKDKWVKALSNSKADEPQTASSAQNPTQPSGTSTFNKDEELDLPKEASAVDFMNDNSEDDFGINNKTQFNPDNFTNTDLGFGSFQAQNFGL